MGQVSSRVLCTEVGIREGEKNLQKTHRIQETVAGIHSVHGSKAILCTCRGTKVFHLVSCPTCSLSPAPSHICRSPTCTKAASSNCHRFKLLKRASYAKLTSPNSVLWWSPNHTIQGQENGKMPSFHGHFQGGRKKLKTRDPWETDPIHWATQITPLSFQEENRNGMCKKTRHEDWPVRSIQWRNPDHFDIHSSKHWLNIYHVSGSNPGKESEWEVGVLGESYASTVENTRSHAAGTGTLSASKKDILTPSLKDPFLAGRMLEVLAF